MIYSARFLSLPFVTVSTTLRLPALTMSNKTRKGTKKKARSSLYHDIAIMENHNLTEIQNGDKYLPIELFHNPHYNMYRIKYGVYSFFLKYALFWKLCFTFLSGYQQGRQEPSKDKSKEGVLYVKENRYYRKLISENIRYHQSRLTQISYRNGTPLYWKETIWNA